MTARIQVIFYSTHGHVYTLAESIAEGCREIPGTKVEVVHLADKLNSSEGT
jgi:multimeric flavodoxin WrbA